jgi:hypothetical protein
MKEEQNCNYEKKGAYKTAKRPPVKKKKKRKEKKKNREKRIRGESCRFWRKPIMLRWLYLWNPPLDHADFWICCSHYTPLITDQRDWKEQNDKNHHLEFHGKQKGNAPAGQFGRRPISLSTTVGSCSFLYMWCS